jgi:hypothetical protein
LARRLKITEISSVGAVDDPDNPPALLGFWKRRAKIRTDTPEVGDIAKGVCMNEGETEAAEVAAVEPVEDLAKQEDVLAVEVEAEAVESAIVTDLAKSLQEAVTKANAERDAAVASLAEEVEKRRTAEWIGKAKPYELLLGPADVMGPALGKIADLLPDEYARLETALKAALARTDLAKILGEVGKDTGETGSPEEQANRFAKEFRMLHPDVTVEQARTRFWQEHPELKQASRERI